MTHLMAAVICAITKEVRVRGLHAVQDWETTLWSTVTFQCVLHATLHRP